MIKKYFGFLLKLIIGGSTWKRLLLFSLAGIVLPFGMLTYYSYRNISEKLVEDYAATNLDSMIFISKYFDRYYKDIRALVLNIYDDNTVFDYLKTGEFDIDKRKNMENRIKTMFYSKDEMQCIKLYTFYDQNLYTITGKFRETFVHIDQDKLTDAIPYYDRIDMVRNSYLSPLYTSENEVYEGDNIFTFNQVIFDIVANRKLAILSYDINTSGFDKQFSMAGFKQGENLLLLDANNQVMYKYGDLSLNDGIIEKLKELNYSDENGYQYLEFIDRDNLVVYYKEPNNLYVTLKIIPVSVLNQSINSIIRRNMEITIVFILTAIIFIIFISNKMSLPVKKLAEYMKKIETGKFNVRIDYKTYSSEFMLLFRSFNLMSEEIHKLFNEKYKLQLAQRSAELKALQAQVNPHFLYNTLQTLQCMALKRDAYEIKAIVEALADILKYCLTDSGHMVKLGEELEYMNKFLMIQRFRYLENLEVIIKAGVETKNLDVPKMILQPLIENCFIHGFENGNGKYEIRICCYSKDSDCIIQIEDNGKGIETDIIKKLEEKMSLLEDESNLEGEQHIGINNVNLRLKLVYKGRSSLKIISVPNVKTMIILSIPLSTEEDDK